MVTTYFANLRKLPANVVPVAICMKSPDGYTGLEYKKLAPKWAFFSEWRKNRDNNYYIEQFNKTVLDGLDATKVVEELKALAGTDKIALVCYEKPGDFCHRHIVSEWLNDNGFKCEEFDEETDWNIF